MNTSNDAQPTSSHSSEIGDANYVCHTMNKALHLLKRDFSEFAVLDWLTHFLWSIYH